MSGICSPGGIIASVGRTSESVVHVVLHSDATRRGTSKKRLSETKMKWRRENKVSGAGWLMFLDSNGYAPAQHLTHWKPNVYKESEILCCKKKNQMTYLLEFRINLRENRKLSKRTQIKYIERTESVAISPMPVLLAALLTWRALFMFKTLVVPQGAMTVEVRSKASRYV